MRVLSTAFFAAAMIFLIAWAVALVSTGLMMAGTVFRLGGGYSPGRMLTGLITTFACYMGYFCCRKISYNLRLRRDW